LFAYGRKALIVSNDLGASWKVVNGPKKDARYRRVDFLTGRTGFALLESGRPVLLVPKDGWNALGEVLELAS